MDAFERAFLTLLRSQGKQGFLDGKEIRALYSCTISPETLFGIVASDDVKAIATVLKSELPANVNGLSFSCNGDHWVVFRKGKDYGDGGVDLLLKEDE